MRTLTALALTLLALTACSSNNDDNDDTSGSTDAGSLPACTDIWVEGNTLPADYDGCQNDNDTIEAAVTQTCTNGDTFTGYDDRYWAILGGEIKDAGATDATADDPEYQADYEQCFAD